jgi:hypothetical protein
VPASFPPPGAIAGLCLPRRGRPAATGRPPATAASTATAATAEVAAAAGSSGQ